MKALIICLFALGSVSSFAKPTVCNLQVTGFYEKHVGIKEEAQKTLMEKGYSNVKFIKRSDEFKKLVLHMGVESNYGSSKKAWIVLADETKDTTDEKYLYSADKGLFWTDELNAYLSLMDEIPTCSDLYGRHR